MALLAGATIASANGSPDDFAYPTYPGPPSYEYQTRLLFPPEAGSSYGYPTYGYPNDRISEDWPPGADHAFEPSS